VSIRERPLRDQRVLAALRRELDDVPHQTHYFTGGEHHLSLGEVVLGLMRLEREGAASRGRDGRNAMTWRRAVPPEATS
jgi:hypothetical protein